MTKPIGPLHPNGKRRQLELPYWKLRQVFSGHIVGTEYEARYRGYIVRTIRATFAKRGIVGQQVNDILDDLVQETFTRACATFRHFKPVDPKTGRKRPFRSWLGGVAFHVSMDYLRGQSRSLATVSLDAAGHDPLADEDRSAGDRIPDEVRNDPVIQVLLYLGFSKPAAAAVCGVTVGAITKRLWRYRQKYANAALCK